MTNTGTKKGRVLSEYDLAASFLISATVALVGVGAPVLDAVHNRIFLLVSLIDGAGRLADTHFDLSRAPDRRHCGGRFKNRWEAFVDRGWPWINCAGVSNTH